MVVCDNGKMNRSEYRKFRIRGVEGANDGCFDARGGDAALSQVARRRKPLPDLIMIDGGKAQLNAAASAMSESARSDSDGRHRQAAAATQRRRVPVDERREDEPIYLDSTR